MTYDRWEIACPDQAAAEKLERAGYGPLGSRILVRRGLMTPEAAASFLKMGPANLHDPFLLDGMREAVERIKQAVAAGETVAVYGDYDADGVTATCVMVRALRAGGLKCLWHIPDREKDGYGLNEAALEELRQKGVTLIVTVDTGVTACDEIAAAKRMGMDVIVTDHHKCREELPDAAAVIDPMRPDNRYPFTGLAGVGVAFKLVCALTGDWRESLIRYADLVALGTVADIMPVVDENRLLITQGIKAMAVTRNPGLLALLRETELLGKPITADTVAFTLGPRVNAAGRVGRADAALELLLTDDPARAGILARSLSEMNILRQSRENEVITEALTSVDENASALVIAGEGWPTGVAGIVAARLAERFDRPVFTICLDGDQARGSARGVPGVNLTDLLAGVSHLLEAYGGHGLAAGFSLRRDNVETFRCAVERLCGELRRTEKVLEIDTEILPGWIDLENLRGLEALSPFGTGFSPPVFCLRDALITTAAPVGGGKHLRLTLDSGGQRLDAVWFNHTVLPPDPCADIAFRAEVNRFRGQETPQLRILDMRQGR